MATQQTATDQPSESGIDSSDAAAWCRLFGTAVGVPVAFSQTAVPVADALLTPRQRAGLNNDIVVGVDTNGCILCSRTLSVKEPSLGTLTVGPLRLADPDSASPASEDASTATPILDGPRVTAILDIAQRNFLAPLRTRNDRDGDVETSAHYHFFVFLHDIADRARAETTVVPSGGTGEQGIPVKSAFLAAMSHDLRTPLNAVIGFADIMRLGTFGPIGNPRYQEYINSICDSATLLIQLIDDILDLSNVEAGLYELQNHDLDLTRILAEARHQMAAMAADFDQTLTITAAPDLPHLRGDKQALLQVLTNLLSNAFKCNRIPGHVSLSAGQDPNGSLIISVTDQGAGMSQEDILRALRPFENANSQIARRRPGTSLGLHLSARLMELFGGQLTIESEHDIGTRVAITFPPVRTVNQTGDAAGETPPASACGLHADTCPLRADRMNGSAADQTKNNQRTQTSSKGNSAPQRF